jgi:predicted 2-oxoglutarate/Fe(II)-dependent dioxygenase YbiX
VINFNPKTNLVEFIQIYDDILSDDLCDRIIDEYSDPVEWFQAGTSDKTLTDVRTCSRIFISDIKSIQKNQDSRKTINNDIFYCVNTAVEKYVSQFTYLDIRQVSDYQLLKYDTNQYYMEHCDSNHKISRAISCAMALNGDYDGGEFAFFSGQHKVKLNKKSVIMFPANFMFPHQILPVTNGTRYSIISWLS